MESRLQIREQQLSMIATWQQSGQNQKQFCLQNNIAYHVFHYWYKVYRSEQTVAEGYFVSVKIASHLQSNVELHLHNGSRIVFLQPVSADFLKALIA